MFFYTEYGQLLLNGAITCIGTWGMWVAFNAGSFLMGQAAVMGVAGYGAGYAFNTWQLPFIVAVLFGVLLGGVFGVLLGMLRARLSGIFFGMATLGLTSLFAVVVNAVPPLGGPLGLTVNYVMDPSTVLAMFGIALVLMAVLVRTPLYRRLKSVGDDPEAAASCGVPVRTESTIALLLAGLLGGLAGVAYIFQLGSVTPDQYGLPLLMQMLVALIAGGLGTVLGPVLGSVVVTLVPYVSGNNPAIFYGIAILVIMLLLPSGLLPRLPRGRDLGYIGRLIGVRKAPLAAEVGAYAEPSTPAGARRTP